MIRPEGTMSSSQASSCDEREIFNSRKRKVRSPKDEYIHEFGQFKIEIKSIINDFKSDQEAKFMSLNENIKDLIAHNQEILKQNLNLQKELENTRRLYNDLKKENDETKDKIKELETQLENNAQKQLASNIEIKIPLTQQGDPNSIVSSIHKVLNVSDDDIKKVYRIKGKHKNIIIVEYKSELTQSTIIKAVKEYNKKNKANKFSTKTIQLEGEKQPIYITEALTPSRRKLYYLARQAIKTSGFQFCWISHGKIFLRKAEGSPIIHVQSHQQIDQLVARKPGSNNDSAV